MKILLSWLAASSIAMSAPGLDAAAPVAPFLGGTFPSTTPGPTGSWQIADAFPNITFTDPVRMVKDPTGDNHVYIVCRSGEIWRMPFNPAATQAQKVRVLDRRANTWGFWDAGMMSLSFHPEFGVSGSPNRGYVYVFYQYLPDGVTNSSVSNPSYMRLSRFSVPDGGVVFDSASEFVLIQQYDRHNWHNGGQTFFGPEGFLHLVIGDEGDANDSLNVTQRINHRLFSGILRIDVDRNPARSHPIRRQPEQISMPAGWQPSFTQGYYIPNDNPWQDPAGGVLEEFWSVGTRSPHSMYFDDETGEIWISEVGQGTREEITIARKGGNHQWPFKEGLANGPKSKPANLIGTEVPPVYDYPRSMGGCIIGGIVYRGTQHSGSLGGKYIFGDHNTRALYALDRGAGGSAQAEYLTSVNRSGGTKSGLSGISEGPDGEVYFMELGNTGTDTGKILKLVRNGATVPDPPRWLSQTGAFTDVSNLTPGPGLIPYGVNSPLWTDGAVKQRWLAIPNDGNHDTAAEQVTYHETGAWEFPVGTVLVKHFAMPVDERDPSITRPIETRFFVHGTDGIYYGVTYQWNAEGTDAELLTVGAALDIDITGSQGETRTQRWNIPSRSDCRTCHSSTADNVLGLRSHQMNGPLDYPATGRRANQLETWNQLGIFGSSFGTRDPATLARSTDPHDPHASLDHRVRSYLDANCSHCHQPGGVSANFNASFDVPLSSQGIVNGWINRPSASPDERVVKPGDPLLSLLHVRASITGSGQMPPLGKNVVDQKAVDLIEDWILSLESASFDFPTGPGIQAEYYEGRSFDTLAFTRVDATIDFDWGSGSPGGGLPSNSFSVRWRARLVPPASGTYTFHTTTDDGTRLVVDGTRIIDRWVDQSPTETSGTVSLTAGQAVDITMEYYENAGGAVARLAWTGPGISKQTVPASAFRLLDSSDNTAPMAKNDNARTLHANSSPVAVLANDSDADAPPGIHGVAITSPPAHGSARISGAGKSLIYTHDGSSARTDSFTYTLTDPQGTTSEPATVNLSIPYDFSAWAIQHPDADGNPDSNFDGDLFPDLLEFALGGSPGDGAAPKGGIVRIDADGSDVSVRIRRPAELSGISHSIETSPDLVTWTSAGAAVSEGTADGLETLRIDGLATQPGLTPDAGFARLRVRLDGSATSFATLPLGWHAVDFIGSRTLGTPFRKEPVFSSEVVETSGLQLSVHGTPPVGESFSGFIEVLSGSYAGHRFEVASTGLDRIVLSAGGPHTLSPVPDLSDARIVLCAHQTLGELFPKDRFTGSTNPAAADQVQIYVNDGTNPGRFELYYLLDARPGNATHQWRAFMPGSGNQDSHPVPPGQGVFVKRAPGSPTLRVLLSGQVRANRFAQPLQAGTNLQASPFPLPLTPREFGLLATESGFTASTNLNAADQFHLHQSGAFRIFYLLDHPSLADFWREAVPSSPNANDARLLLPTEAVFLKRATPAPTRFVPSIWSP